MYDVTKRKGNRWVRVSGSRGKWHVAQGWKGEHKAAHCYTVSTKAFALVLRDSWLNDQ